MPFVFIYTLGNILALLASMFLCGPQQQLKNMMDKKRKISAIIYVSCVLVTVILIFIPIEGEIKLAFLVLLLLLQFSAGLWYNLSYIPMGRRMFCKCAKGLLGVEDDGSNSIIYRPASVV